MNKLSSYLEKHINVEKYLSSYPGLIVFCTMVLFFLVTKFDVFLEKGVSCFEVRCLIYMVIELIVVGLWIYYKNYLPKNKNGIGLVIALQTENKKQKTRIRNDFARELNTLLEGNNINFINTIILTNTQSILLSEILSSYAKKKLELKRAKRQHLLHKTREYKRWRKVRGRIKGHYYLWGNIKERLDEENKYIITVNGLVVHRRVRDEKIRAMLEDSLKYFPNNISFSEKFELKGFQLTADLMYFFARYIIGCAAFFSGDYYTAYNLFNGLTEHNLCLTFIRKKIILFLSDCLAVMAFKEYNEGNKHLSLRYATESLSYNQINTIAFDFFTVFYFKERRECDVALLYAKRSGESLKRRPGCWQYNEAFLYMYTGKFYRAIERYKKIARENFENEENVVDECISFNEQLYREEPQKKQCLFIIAFLYFIKKGNLPLALEKFESFIEETNGIDGYNYLRMYANDYILQIEQQMGLSVSHEVAPSAEN